MGIHVVNLPASTKSTALQMAEKQLLILGGEEEQLLAADFFPSSQEGMLRGVVYTAPGSWLWAVKISCFTGQAAFKRNPSVTCLCGILSGSQRVWYGRKSHGAGPSVRRLYRPV